MTLRIIAIDYTTILPLDQTIDNLNIAYPLIFTIPKIFDLYIQHGNFIINDWCTIIIVKHRLTQGLSV